MWFESWGELARTAVSAVVAYAALLVFLRVSGSRTLSTLNAFDMVVTVALGSTLATTILSADVTVSEGALALAILVALQYVITWSSVRMGRIQKVVKAEAVLLVRDGEILDGAAKRARVTTGEIYQAVRSEGFDDPKDVGALVLETNGEFSVLAKVEERSRAIDRVTDD